ncbi:MAG: hypothetical protein KDN20_01495 [Verrucomicrobiae bacterium]|nr:hypothetical protein [Verrucomicrobiae bacterium]
MSAGINSNVPRLAVQAQGSDLDHRGAKDDRLSPDERNRWKELDEVVKRGIREIRKVGEALLEIREKNLYREDFPTWKDYCETVLEMSRQQANRMIICAEVLADLAPFGAKFLPKGESQIRELARLPTPELRQRAWGAVLDRDHQSTITAKVVRAEVEKIGSKNGIASSQLESSENANPEENCGEEKDSPSSKSPISAKVKSRRFEAEYVQPPWFDGRDESQFLPADSSGCDFSRFTSEESFITATQVTKKLTSMANNNVWARENCQCGILSTESVAEQQQLFIALVDAINRFASLATSPSLAGTVFRAVDELGRFTTYLKPVPTTEKSLGLDSENESEKG